jgi:hypothetical protein
MTMKEEAKAVQEMAKVAGKAIDAGQQAGAFIARFIGGPLEQAAGIFEDRLRYARWERQQRLMRRAQEFMEQSKMTGPTRAVPLKLAIPIFQGAGLEDDDNMQDRWAALLVNAANADFHLEIRRAYLDILEQISPLDAKILDLIYELPFHEMQHNGVLTAALPSSVRVAPEDLGDPTDPPEEVALALGNLIRVGCLKASTTWGGGEVLSRVNPTLLGQAFVFACRLPTK